MMIDIYLAILTIACRDEFGNPSVTGKDSVVARLFGPHALIVDMSQPVVHMSPSSSSLNIFSGRRNLPIPIPSRWCRRVHAASYGEWFSSHRQPILH